GRGLKRKDRKSDKSDRVPEDYLKNGTNGTGV
ncbi:unnamed protein product, partial [marine sediment metagenome]